MASPLNMNDDVVRDIGQDSHVFHLADLPVRIEGHVRLRWVQRSAEDVDAGRLADSLPGTRQRQRILQRIARHDRRQRRHRNHRIPHRNRRRPTNPTRSHRPRRHRHQTPRHNTHHHTQRNPARRPPTHQRPPRPNPPGRPDRHTRRTAHPPPTTRHHPHRPPDPPHDPPPLSPPPSTPTPPRRSSTHPPRPLQARCRSKLERGARASFNLCRAGCDQHVDFRADATVIASVRRARVQAAPTQPSDGSWRGTGNSFEGWRPAP